MPHLRVPGLAARATRLLVGAVLAALVAPVLPAAAAEPDYPACDSRYHTNAEMVAEIHAAEAAYPDLVDVLSIGKSYAGPRHLGRQGLRQRRRRRGRARGAGRRPPPRPRAPDARAGALPAEDADPGLRHRPGRPRGRGLAGDLDHLLAQPRRARLRPEREPVSPLAQEPPGDPRLALRGHRPQPQLRLPLGLLRRLVVEPGGLELPRPGALLGARDAAPCATS